MPMVTDELHSGVTLSLSGKYVGISPLPRMDQSLELQLYDQSEDSSLLYFRVDLKLYSCTKGSSFGEEYSQSSLLHKRPRSRLASCSLSSLHELADFDIVDKHVLDRSLQGSGDPRSLLCAFCASFDPKHSTSTKNCKAICRTVQRCLLHYVRSRAGLWCQSACCNTHACRFWLVN